MPNPDPKRYGGYKIIYAGLGNNTDYLKLDQLLRCNEALAQLKVMAP